MCGFYLRQMAQECDAGAKVMTQSFLAWHRPKQYDRVMREAVARGGRHQHGREPTMVVACRYWYELTDGFWGQFVLTQIPHKAPQGILPRAETRYLESMRNFAGMLQYLCGWRWAEEGVVRGDDGSRFCVAALPLVVDDAGEVTQLGAWRNGELVFEDEVASDF